MADIYIDPHTLERAAERGASASEIEEVLRTGTEAPAKRGRRSKAKVFEFNTERLGKRYAQKRIEVIYTVGNGTMVTVTVYVFYGQWSN